MNDEQRKARLEKIKLLISGLEQEQDSLIEGCTCSIVHKTPYGSAVCSICNENYGWWCPDSPTNACDYGQEDGEYDEDCCRYCGKPEERK